jgi:hypothetical protein
MSTLPPRTADTMSEAIALSSPNGRMSDRAKRAAQERLRVALFGPQGLQRGQCPQPTKAERLEGRIRTLRDLAARGMSKRAFTKEADALQAELDQITAS